MTYRRVIELAQAIAENAWHQGRLQVACRNLATQWKAKDESVPKAAPPYAVEPAGPLTEAQLAAAIYCYPRYGPWRSHIGPGRPCCAGCKCETHFRAVRALLIDHNLIALDPVGPDTAAR